MTTIIGLFDGFICGMIIFTVIMRKCGSKPAGRAIAVLTALLIGVLYFLWEESLADTPSSQLADWVYPVVLFGPCVLLLVLLFLKFVFKSRQ